MRELIKKLELGGYKSNNTLINAITQLDNDPLGKSINPKKIPQNG